jgi:hypothetical protein
MRSVGRHPQAKPALARNVQANHCDSWTADLSAYDCFWPKAVVGDV